MNKIIQLRGTSGAGKSTIVKSLIELATWKTPHFVEKRKQPLYYDLTFATGAKLVVLGHYEIACGGCDTISGFDLIFNMVRQHADESNVLFEGVLLNDDYLRTKALGSVDVIFLNTTLEECLASVNARRATRGVTEPVNPKNTTGRYNRCLKTFKKFQTDAPLARAYSLNRADALTKVKELLAI